MATINCQIKKSVKNPFVNATRCLSCLYTTRLNNGISTAMDPDMDVLAKIPGVPNQDLRLQVKGMFNNQKN